jgi:hypothetical protein
MGYERIKTNRIMTDSSHLDNAPLLILELTEGELKSLLRMIQSANLPERRDWHSIKQKIEKILQNQTK